MKRLKSMMVIVLVLAGSTLWAAEPTRWINVNVTEPESETNVEVHLPLNLVITILEGVKVENFHYGKVELEIDDSEIDWLAIFAAIKDSPDGDFVTAKTEDADVKITKKNGTMYVKVLEKGGDHAEVDLNVPMDLVHALSVDDENRIDVVALLSSIETLPDGDLVRVSSDEANVRIWVE